MKKINENNTELDPFRNANDMVWGPGKSKSIYFSRIWVMLATHLYFYRHVSFIWSDKSAKRSKPKIVNAAEKKYWKDISARNWINLKKRILIWNFGSHKRTRSLIQIILSCNKPIGSNQWIKMKEFAIETKNILLLISSPLFLPILRIVNEENFHRNLWLFILLTCNIRIRQSKCKI